MQEKPNYSVIVPVFNSASTLPELVNRIDAVMQQYAPYELLLVDDFSEDDSWEVLKEAKAGREHIRLLRLTRNFGQPAVILCGTRESKADTLITIDDDLQFPPEEIHKLISHFDPKEHYILFGVPEKKQNGALHAFASKVIERTIRYLAFSQKPKDLRFSTFRILSRKKYNHQGYNESRMRSIQVFFTMVSPKLMKSIIIDHQPRKKGRSSYSLVKRFKIFTDLIIVLSEFPTYLFIFLFLLFSMGTAGFISLLTLGASTALTQPLALVLILLGLCSTMLGFIFLFGYLRRVYLGYMGAEAYAVWEEA